MNEKPDFISFCKPTIGEEEINEVVACLRSGWLTTGARAKRFEEDFSGYAGARFAVAVNSCTAALHLALEALGLREGELVLVPSMTFAATAEVVRYFQATPVLVDCREDDFCMDMARAEDLIRKIQAGAPVPGVPADHGPLRGMIPVHFAGQVADVLKARELCERHQLFLVEDCAHCCPARYQDRQGRWQMAGRSADVACFSFYANKTITTGEGGMAVTDKEEWADRMRVMSLHGISKDAWKRFSKSGNWYYEITAPGFKYNMPDLAAALGIHQLQKADTLYEARKKIAATYARQLAGIPGLVLPVERADRQHSWHLYIVRIEAEKTGVGRDRFIEDLKAANIGVGVHYIPLHLHPYYVERYGFKPDDLPVADQLSRQIVSLPIYPLLREEEIDYICQTVRTLLSRPRDGASGRQTSR